MFFKGVNPPRRRHIDFFTTEYARAPRRSRRGLGRKFGCNSVERKWFVGREFGCDSIVIRWEFGRKEGDCGKGNSVGIQL